MAAKKETDRVSREVEANEITSLEAKLDAMKAVNDTQSESGNESTEIVAKTKKSSKTTKPKKAAHGTKHQSAVKLVEHLKSYQLSEALELVKKTSYTAFDGALDVHVRLAAAKKSDDNVRGTVTLPHGTGKEKRVVIIDEPMIEKIEKGWLDFDIAVTTPEMMPKLAKLAKVLGPKGLMPNPKSGTVSTEPEKIAQELKVGRVEFKADSLGNIHQSIGRVSWDDAKLIENFQVFIAALPKSRLKSVTIAPTMGPGVKVSL